MAAWRCPDFYNYGLWVPEWNTVWSHNGYLDLLLGGGTIGGLFFVLYLWFGASDFRARSINVALPKLFLASFALAAATQESFFIGSHFLWALLVAALIPTPEAPESVNEQHAS
jgi:O-antigen ligase